MAVRVAINGMGRIGRCFVRAAWNDPDVDMVAFNDVGNIENIAYLLRHDSVYRGARFDVRAEGRNLILGGKEIHCVSERDPERLPWKDMRIDVVVESTGVFDSFEKASAHLRAGAKRVVITAPVKDAMEGAATVLVGVNEEKLQTCLVTSNASCTTNSASPVIAILDEALGIEKAILSTTHSYTATQSLVDAPVKDSDFRHGRAAAQNIVPHSTGAAIAVTKAYEQLVNKFDGIAMRVPTVAGSLSDITFVSKRDTTVEEVNSMLEEAAGLERWKGIFAVTKEPLVSSDIIGRTEGSIADLAMTRVVGGTLVKVLAWYDNEMGYTYTLLRHVKKTGAYV